LTKKQKVGIILVWAGFFGLWWGLAYPNWSLHWYQLFGVSLLSLHIPTYFTLDIMANEEDYAYFERLYTKEHHHASRYSRHAYD
jgi:hypothetical protein